MISMKKKSKKLKSYVRLHGERIESSFNELDHLEPRQSTNSKILFQQILNSLSHEYSKIK